MRNCGLGQSDLKVVVVGDSVDAVVDGASVEVWAAVVDGTSVEVSAVVVDGALVVVWAAVVDGASVEVCAAVVDGSFVVDGAGGAQTASESHLHGPVLLSMQHELRVDTCVQHLTSSFKT